MSPKARVVLLQRQLSIAVKVLKEIRDGDSFMSHMSVAENALEEIERIKLVQEGVSP